MIVRKFRKNLYPHCTGNLMLAQPIPLNFVKAGLDPAIQSPDADS